MRRPAAQPSPLSAAACSSPHWRCPACRRHAQPSRYTPVHMSARLLVHPFLAPTSRAPLVVCSARDALAISMADNKPRRRQAPQPQHPLLGAAPTLRLMRTATMGGPMAPRQQEGGVGLLGLLGLGVTDEAIPQRLEPKVCLAGLGRQRCWPRGAACVAHYRRCRGATGTCPALPFRPRFCSRSNEPRWRSAPSLEAEEVLLLRDLSFHIRPNERPGPPPLPQTFLASERTFLSWMHMAITLGSIAAALLAFAAGSKKSKSPMHTVGAGSCSGGLADAFQPAGRHPCRWCRPPRLLQVERPPGARSAGTGRAQAAQQSRGCGADGPPFAAAHLHA